jgi:hypothetical protein
MALVHTSIVNVKKQQTNLGINKTPEMLSTQIGNIIHQHCMVRVGLSTASDPGPAGLNWLHFATCSGLAEMSTFSKSFLTSGAGLKTDHYLLKCFLVTLGVEKGMGAELAQCSLLHQCFMA